MAAVSRKRVRDSAYAEQRVEGEEAGGDDGRPDHRWAGDKEGPPAFDAGGGSPRR